MDVKKHIVPYVATFEKELSKFLVRQEPLPLYDASLHLPFAGGKRLRPIISMIACEAVIDNSERVLPFSMSLELIHNFTLVHDDIMDHSHMRRNIPTVHESFGEPTAILAGDLLFAKAFEALQHFKGDSSVANILYGLLISAVIEVCEGQQLDMDFENRAMVSEDEYLSMIQKKTSALFRIAAEGGGIAADASNVERNALKIYGNNLGLAFQIRDDVLDMSSSLETLGKDIGMDIRNGKKTLIAVHALKHAKGKQKQLLTEVFGNRDATEEQVEMVTSLFQEIGSLSYADEKASSFCQIAIDALDPLKDSMAKEFLKSLAVFAKTRKK
jgi:geranylgeranyl diphosphate synthase type I